MSEILIHPELDRLSAHKLFLTSRRVSTQNGMDTMADVGEEKRDRAHWSPTLS